MKKTFLFLLALLSFQCNRHSANKNFDLKINVDIGNYKYTRHPITEAEFHVLKTNITKTWPQQILATSRSTTGSDHEATPVLQSKYSAEEYIRIANDMETFKKTLLAPGQYLKTTAASPEIAVLEYNKVFAPLSDECIAEPVNYSDLITTAMQGILADNNIKLEVCYGFKQTSTFETKYTIYAKLDHTLHTVTFSNTKGCTPDNTAIYLLLNKVLMSTDIKERLVRYSDHNSLIFVQPARYERLTRRLAQP
ncbi:hypothetical protein [Chitinophaga ginsengisoli]|uniref:Uncharacterized protein n=1 Tax=Chitinophaga ginsengisoli TaxID=363837 RepID=A0A2P8FMA9_9BACT|nr:hypothetical protein [Chitinophaga ginsengisoli]PSL22864.1 hypothetical protein CLV42_120126 [Chitinophaga ginsengisoli]